MRILFMGTPDIAADCLKALYEAGHDICAVYTRRDKLSLIHISEPTRH